MDAIHLKDYREDIEKNSQKYLELLPVEEFCYSGSDDNLFWMIYIFAAKELTIIRVTIFDYWKENFKIIHTWHQIVHW